MENTQNLSWLIICYCCHCLHYIHSGNIFDSQYNSQQWWNLRLIEGRGNKRNNQRTQYFTNHGYRFKLDVSFIIQITELKETENHESFFTSKQCYLCWHHGPPVLRFLTDLPNKFLSSPCFPCQRSGKFCHLPFLYEKHILNNTKNALI